MPRLTKRHLAVLLANLLSLAIIAATASVVMLKSHPATAGGKPVDPDSIAVTNKLEKYEFDVEDSKTILVTATFTGKAFLVPSENTALAGATVRYELPRLGVSGVMQPAGPGEYSYTHTEQIRIQSPVPLLDTRNWTVRNLKIERNGQDETDQYQQSEKTFSGLNFTRSDVTGAGLKVFDQPKTYNVDTRRRISFQVMKPDGTPAANLTAVVELPQRNYRESFRTDEGGWVRIDRVDELRLRVQGGQLVEIQGPIFIEPPDPITLFWWEEPVERCEMAFRASQKRLATRPGNTAQFGFEIINRGNRPDTYRLKVEGVPADWVEVEYGGVVTDLLPWLGQVVYVNVTPPRLPDTKLGSHKITATVTGLCDTKTAVSDLKVMEFHQPDLELTGATLDASPRVAADLRQQAARADEADRITVLVRSGGPLPATAATDIKGLGGKVRQELGIINGLSVEMPAGKLQSLAALPWVKQVDKNRSVKALIDKSVPAAGAKQLWELGFDGSGVKVAIVDTGVDYLHPALAGRVIKGPDFANGDDDPMDGNGHGTHVAGIVGSAHPQLKGVAPGATVVAVKVLDDEGSGTYESVIAGVDWAVRSGADVINLSLGGPAAGGNDPLAQAVDNAVKSGVLVVVAAGNGGPDFSTLGSPGDARLALTVGATDNARALTDWSSRGPTLDGRAKPDLVAPGNEIVSLAPGGGLETMSGTSMATPHVAGLGALLVQATRAEPLLIKEGLMRTATRIGGPTTTGAGFPNPAAALDWVRKAQSMVRSDAFPGEVAGFGFDLFNQGNVDDRFRLTQWFDDHNLKYAAQNKLPGTAIRSYASALVKSGETGQAEVQIRVPDDWAGMEDTVYVFHLLATSMADRNAVDEDRATLLVKANRRSMAEFVKLEIRDLRDEAARGSMDGATRLDLMTRIEALAAEEQKALDAIIARDDGAAAKLLASARSLATALEQRVAARAAAGAIAAGDAEELKARLKAIQEHLAQAEKKS